MPYSRDAFLKLLAPEDRSFAEKVLEPSRDVTVDYIEQLVRSGRQGVAKLFRYFGVEGFSALCQLAADGTLKPRTAIPFMGEYTPDPSLIDCITNISSGNSEYARIVIRLAAALLPAANAKQVVDDYLGSDDQNLRSAALSQMHDTLSADGEKKIFGRQVLLKHVDTVRSACKLGNEDAQAALLASAAYRDDPFLTIIRETANNRDLDISTRVFACAQYLRVYDIRSGALAAELKRFAEISTILRTLYFEGSQSQRADLVRVVFAFGLEETAAMVLIIQDARRSEDDAIVHAVSDGEALSRSRWL